MIRISFFLLCFLFFIQAEAQQSSTTVNVKEVEIEHSPKKASILSAILPGAGQAYNRKYWKIPIVYTGLGASAYFIIENNKQLNIYKNAYLLRMDDDPTTVDQFDQIYSDASLLTLHDTYRRWRDLSYVCLSFIYVLNIVDASVDANLMRFDVGEDITMNVTPFYLSSPQQSAQGVTLSLNF